MNQRRKFKLVILGDEKVGKTSFIQRLMQSNLTDQKEKLPPVYLPNEMFQNDCVTIIFDTEYVPGQIPDEVNEADIIILMYDITNSNTADRLKGFWLKKLDDMEIKKPIIIVGNKIDRVDDLEDQDIEPQRIFRVIKPLVKDYNRVEMGIECSALTKRGLNDVINCAQRSYLYPLAPIYSFGRRQITDQFKKALTRIFRICDKDGDNFWNDQELIRFQKKVFRRQLDNQDIQGIKGMISEELKIDQIEHINLEGFIALQKRGVELMKIQICWTILRHFHYNDDLLIDELEFQNEILIDKDSGQTIELSESALQFIDRLFRHRDKEVLSRADIEQILYPVVFEHHLPVDNLYGPINRDGWIALWNAYVFKNYKEAYKLLKYIGYDGKLHHCFKETARKDNWNSLSKFADRKTFGISIVVKQKDKYARLFHDKYQLIAPFKNKTYIFDLMNLREAETQSELIGSVDLFIIEEGLLFQYEKIIPFISLRQGLDFDQIIAQASNSITVAPFGYNEGQIIILKQQNGITAIHILSIVILGLSAAFGTKLILNRIKQK